MANGITYSKLIISEHAYLRLKQRKIHRSLLETAIRDGEIIAVYPEDKPYPTKLIVSTVEHKIIHLVVALDEMNGVCVIVTVYEPDVAIWEDNFRKRRRK
jgi:hypothetical protein